VTIQYRWAEGRSERLAAIAAEFVRLKVAVIVTNGNAAVAATKQTTSDIPIVFPIANDPLGAGLVASLGRPGGNATGTSIQESDTAGKRLELLHEGAPGSPTRPHPTTCPQAPARWSGGEGYRGEGHIMGVMYFTPVHVPAC
jgi:ABC-type uncharacterized transport system substrate-binding protein